jgi:paraquat-inducible protein B
MTTDNRSAGDFPRPEVHTPRMRLSPIWAIPIVAVLVVSWLAYQALSQRGPTITITFQSGAGLEAAKTRVKHNDVDVGVVEKVALSPDLKNVIVTARMDRNASQFLNEHTRFWVVRPRLSLSNLSGLETLFSGSYIEMDPGDGAPTREFTGLEEPPPRALRPDVPGTEFVLDADRLGSLGPGTPVYFHGVKVGEVLGNDKLSPQDPKIKIHIQIDRPYDQLVHEGTRFWNDSGISVKADLTGIKVEMESLSALLSGGVGFDNMPQAILGGQAKPGHPFTLYASLDAAREATFVQQVPFIVEFDGSVQGLEIGAPVEFRGIRVGEVKEIHLQYDRDTLQVHIPVLIAFEPQRVERVVRQKGVPVSEESSMADVMRAMQVFVTRGLRAQLRSQSLLSGKLFVAFDFFPTAAAAQIVKEGNIPVLPSVPSSAEDLQQNAGEVLDQVSAILARVQKMPLEGVVGDARGALQAIRALADSPQISAVLGSADKTLNSADATLSQIDDLVASVNSGYGNDSEARQRLVALLREFQETARSMKVLADSLEEHPEALIRGKGGVLP